MEQKEKGKLNSYFQIIGVVVLLSHTLLMALEILWGLLLVLLTFAKDLFLTVVNFMQLQNLVLLAVWILLLACLTNSQMLRIEKDCIEQPNAQNKQNKLCFVCRKQPCEICFSPCLHSFHLQCMRVGYAGVEAAGCPECSKLNGSRQNYFLSRLEQLYNANHLYSQIFIAVFVFSGFYGFFQMLKQA